MSERDDAMGLKESARYLGIAPLTLRHKSVYQRLVAFHRVGRRLVYRRADLDDFLKRCRVPAREG